MGLKLISRKISLGGLSYFVGIVSHAHVNGDRRPKFSAGCVEKTSACRERHSFGSQEKKMNRAGRWLDLLLLFFLLPQIMPSVGVQGRELCAASDTSCAAEAGQRSRSSSLLPVYDNVEAGSKTAVCIVSKASELQGLRIALLTILLQQPQMKVQLFAFDNVEEALADAISRMVSLLAPDGRSDVSIIEV